ncbi:MAG: hypothetical protein WD341_06025 [Tistlia sp.]|uniref:hypothetical protein n=1 Tax=Tistlia sp. TaxID=3057121 RepID=UPI0034A58537
MPARGIVETETEGTGSYDLGDPIGDTFQLPVQDPNVVTGDLTTFYVVDSLEAATKLEINGPAAVTSVTQARNVTQSYNADAGGWGTAPINWGQGKKFIVYDLDVATITRLMAFIYGTDGNPRAGFRNLLANPLGTINQRAYTSGAATSGAAQYTLDRWRVVTSGQALSWTESQGVRTMLAPAGGVEQPVEGSWILSGTHTISWEGSATCTVDGVAKDSGDTVTLTGATNSTVRFSAGTFRLPQLEPGAIATPFERRPLAAELALCQRYYEAVAGNITMQKLRESDRIRTAHAHWKVTKRVTPTVTKTDTLEGFSSIGLSPSVSGFSLQTGGSGGDASAPFISNVRADAEI